MIAGLGALAVGDEDDFGPEEGMRLVKNGFAVPASQPLERAVKPPPRETRDPLDRDGDGHRGGSPKGEESSAGIGARRRKSKK